MAPCLCAGGVLADPIGDDRLQPGVYPVAPLPEGFDAPMAEAETPLDIDWSVGLRGTQTSTNQGSSFDIRLVPQIGVAFVGSQAEARGTARAELARGSDGTVTATGLALTGDVGLEINRDARAFGQAGLRFERELPNRPGQDPQIIQGADLTAAHVDLGYDHSFGRFNLGLKGGVERLVYGATSRRDTGITSNDAQNRWSADTSLRLGYQATPIFEVFGQGELGRHWFDAANARTGVAADAYTRNLKLGVEGKWGEVLTANASLGYGQYLFVHGNQSVIDSQLYEASLTFRPDPTLSITGLVGRTIEPTGADSSGAVRIVDRARVDTAYRVNSLLQLRANAELAHSKTQGSGESEDRQSAGLGADYALGLRTKIGADYNYAHRTNSATGTLDSHQVSLGVTLQR